MEFNEKRYDWLISQKKWHAKREGEWHKSQVRFYSRAARAMPLSLSYIVTKTIRENAPRLIANISKYNALFARLKASRLEQDHAK